MKNINENKPKIRYTNEARKQHVPINQLKITAPRRMKAAVCFACAGLCEYYLPDIGVDVVCANELDSQRAELHHSLYPNCTMVIGDITTKEIQDKMVELINKEQCEILMMSPKCQQFTIANCHRDPDSDELFLFESVLQNIVPHCPSLKYIMNENAEQFLEYPLQRYGGVFAGDRIEEELKNCGFPNVVKAVQNAAGFGVAMSRPRSIVVAARDKKVQLPTPSKTTLTLEDVIDDLPTLESRQRGKHWADVVKYIPKCQREQIEITPCGERVQNRLTKSGNISGAEHKGTFRRAKWEEPMHSVLTNNGDISAYHMIHPGRMIVDKTGKPILNKDGKQQFTDCRPFTIHEIFRALRLPDDIRIPDWAKPKTSLIRTIIGEAFAPLHAQAVIAEFVKAEFGIK